MEFDYLKYLGTALGKYPDLTDSPLAVQVNELRNIVARKERSEKLRLIGSKLHELKLNVNGKEKAYLGILKLVSAGCDLAKLDRYSQENALTKAYEHDLKDIVRLFLKYGMTDKHFVENVIDAGDIEIFKEWLASGRTSKEALSDTYTVQKYVCGSGNLDLLFAFPDYKDFDTEQRKNVNDSLSAFARHEYKNGRGSKRIIDLIAKASGSELPIFGLVHEAASYHDVELLAKLWEIKDSTRLTEENNFFTNALRGLHDQKDKTKVIEDIKLAETIDFLMKKGMVLDNDDYKIFCGKGFETTRVCLENGMDPNHIQDKYDGSILLNSLRYVSSAPEARKYIELFSSHGVDLNKHVSPYSSIPELYSRLPDADEGTLKKLMTPGLPEEVWERVLSNTIGARNLEFVTQQKDAIPEELLLKSVRQISSPHSWAETEEFIGKLIELFPDKKAKILGSALAGVAYRSTKDADSYLSTLQLIIDKGADIEYAGQNGLAGNLIKQASHEQLKAFFKKNKFSKAVLNSPSCDGSPAIVIAAGLKAKGKVLQLLTEGADVNAVDIHGNNALLTACNHHDKNLIELLLKYPVEVKATANNGYGVLHKLIGDKEALNRNGWEVIVKTLIERGAPFEREIKPGQEVPGDAEKRKGLTNQVFHQFPRLLGTMLDNGAPINSVDNGRPLLHSVLSNSSFDNVKEMVLRGADIFQTNADGESILNLAEDKAEELINLYVSNYAEKYRNTRQVGAPAPVMSLALGLELE